MNAMSRWQRKSERGREREKVVAFLLGCKWRSLLVLLPLLALGLEGFHRHLQLWLLRRKPSHTYKPSHTRARSSVESGKGGQEGGKRDPATPEEVTCGAKNFLLASSTGKNTKPPSEIHIRRGCHPCRQSRQSTNVARGRAQVAPGRERVREPAVFLSKR
jgi:hypothetical protein